MKRTLLSAALAAGCIGSASAQDPSAALSALSQSVVDLRITSITLLQGNAGATTVNLANTVNNLTTGLAGGTPLEPLAVAGVDLSNTLVDGSTAITPLLTDLAAPGAELGAPFVPVFASSTNFLVGGLPFVQGDPEAGLNTLMNILNSPATAALMAQLVGELSPDNFDSDRLVALLSPATLTGLADGGPVSLPIPIVQGAGLEGLALGLGNFPALPIPAAGNGGGGAPALPLDALDPAVLTSLLGSGLPGADGGGAPALPLDALDPAILTSLLGGGLPGADGGGAPALPLDALDPAVLTALLDGGLPALPAP